MTTPKSALAILLTSHVNLDTENILRCLDAGIDTVLAVVPEVEDVLFVQAVSESLGGPTGKRHLLHAWRGEGLGKKAHRRE